MLVHLFKIVWYSFYPIWWRNYYGFHGWFFNCEWIFWWFPISFFNSLQRYEVWKLVLNWKKCNLIGKERTVLGHKIFEKRIEVDMVRLGWLQSFLHQLIHSPVIWDIVLISLHYILFGVIPDCIRCYGEFFYLIL